MMVMMMTMLVYHGDGDHDSEEACDDEGLNAVIMLAIMPVMLLAREAAKEREKEVATSILHYQ